MTEPIPAAESASSLAGRGSNSLRALFGQSLGYMAGGLAYKAVALLTVPLLARLLSPAELGLLDLAAVTASIVGLLAGLGTENAVARLEPGEQDEGRLWGSALILIGGGALAALGGGILLREPLAALLVGDPGQGALLMAAVGYGAALATATAALNVVRLRTGARRYAIWGFLLVTAEMGVAVTIALLLADPVVPMVIGWTVASATGALIVAVVHLPRLRPPSVEVARRLLRFGVPLVPATVAWLLGDVAIRAAIAHAGDLTVLGHYGIAFRIASVMTLAVAGFGLAWHPFLYRSELRRALAQARHAMLQLLLGLGLAAIAMSTLAPELVALIAGPRYEGAAAAVPLLTGAMVAFGLFTLLAAVAGISYRTWLAGAAGFIGGAVQLGVAWLLVADHGIVAAGLAALAGYLVATTILLPETRQLALRVGDVMALTVVWVALAASLGALLILGHEAALPARIAATLPGSVILFAVWRSAGRTNGRDGRP